MTDPVRLTVFRILKQILSDRAYANELSRDLLDDARFDARDRAFASAMLYGTLSYLPNIDYQLNKVSDRDIDAYDLDVATVLRMGAWQIKFSYGVPAHAAVNESVDLIKAIGKTSAAGLVNAVLRKLSRADISFPNRYRGPELGLSTEIFGMFKKWFGDAEAEALAKALLEPTEGITIRARSRDYIDTFRQLGPKQATIRPGDYFEHAFTVIGAGHAPDTWPGFAEGAFFVQDEASMAVGHLMRHFAERVQRGGVIRMLDACAGVGGKSIDRALYGENLLIEATEPHRERFELLRDNTERMKTDTICPIHTDFFRFEGKDYDQILLDVPCSGLGVLANKPEIKLGLSYDALRRFPAEQLKFLEHAAAKVKSGGQLWYSTCTLNPDENENLVIRFMEDHPEFTPIRLAEAVPETLAEADPVIRETAENGYLTLYPHRVKTDGFFVAGMEKHGTN